MGLFSILFGNSEDKTESEKSKTAYKSKDDNKWTIYIYNRKDPIGSDAEIECWDKQYFYGDVINCSDGLYLLDGIKPYPGYDVPSMVFCNDSRVLKSIDTEEYEYITSKFVGNTAYVLLDEKIMVFNPEFMKAHCVNWEDLEDSEKIFDDNVIAYVKNDYDFDKKMEFVKIGCVNMDIAKIWTKKIMDKDSYKGEEKPSIERDGELLLVHAFGNVYKYSLDGSKQKN